MILMERNAQPSLTTLPTSFATDFLAFLHSLVTYFSSLPDEVKCFFQAAGL